MQRAQVSHAAADAESNARAHAVAHGESNSNAHAPAHAVADSCAVSAPDWRPNSDAYTPAVRVANGEPDPSANASMS